MLCSSCIFHQLTNKIIHGVLSIKLSTLPCVGCCLLPIDKVTKDKNYNILKMYRHNIKTA